LIFEFVESCLKALLNIWSDKMNLFCLICHRYCNCGIDEIIAFSGDRAYVCTFIIMVFVYLFV